jgi:peptide chain release factor 2
MIYGGHFDILGKKEKISELENKSMQSDFWSDTELANKVIDEMNSLKEIVNMVEDLKNDVNNDLELNELLLEANDEELLHNLEDDVKTLCQKIDKAEIFLLLSGPYDKNNCLLEIHSGAGGTEACDWADMLFRMYLRYLEKNGFKYEVLSYLDGDEVGLKSASIKVNGAYAYGYLKGEKGVHRLVRLSPFDANHKRHTSFASVDITPEFNNDVDVKIDEKDLKIDVYRASGAGGQHVNRTESAVRITHLPTKIVVTCQNQRSQLQNKETCMNVLKGKLKLLEIEKQEKEMNSIKGDTVITSFGSQIRSYVMHPYSLVKDHRTGYETSNVLKVLDGDIEGFIEKYLKG